MLLLLELIQESDKACLSQQDSAVVEITALMCTARLILHVDAVRTAVEHVSARVA